MSTFAAVKRVTIYFMIALLVLTGCTTPARRAAMRRGLDSLSQLNRNRQTFSVAAADSLVLFFDRYGTPDEQLLSHYLLGRAYYLHGDAPMALQCYQEAIECADTNPADSTCKLLCRVYGQMAGIFYHQGLYRQQLENEQKSVLYAWLGKDTLAALMNYEQENLAYQRLGMVDSALYIIGDVFGKYKQYGYHVEAATSLGVIIRTLIDKGEYAKAKQYMDIYESESGLFNNYGDIEPGREIYYRAKGLYYLYTNRLDSAENYFRKELCLGKDFNNQNAAAMGLTTLYQSQHYTDSAVKYAIYAYAMNDSIYARRATETVERMQAMYDYSRHQEEAHKEQEIAERRAIIIWICVGLIIIVCLMTLVFIRELTHKKEKAEQRYLQSQSFIEQARQDIAKLQANENINRELISEKEQTIREQETIMKTLLHGSNSQSLTDKKLKEADIYKTFEQLSIIGRQPTDKEWKQMEELCFLCYPEFKDFIWAHEYHLNDKERKTCILVRTGFRPNNISHMLDVAPSYISILRTDMLNKLFNLSGNSKTFDKLIKGI